MSRIPAPEGEQRHQRLKRETRESDVWIRQVNTIGTPAAGTIWVHVGDRGADMFPFFQACQATQTHFLVRAGKSRRVLEHEEAITYELPRARALKSQASRPNASSRPAWTRSRVRPSRSWPLGS